MPCRGFVFTAYGTVYYYYPVWWYTIKALFLFCVWLFVWCLCMAINVSVQYNGKLLPDIILLIQCYYHRGTRLNAIKRFCLRSPWSHLNVLTFSPLIGGCWEGGLDAFRFFFKHHPEAKNVPGTTYSPYKEVTEMVQKYSEKEKRHLQRNQKRKKEKRRERTQTVVR